MNSEPQAARILVIKLSSLGDLLHALPAVQSLRTGLGAAIDWLTQTEYADLVRCFRPVDRVLVWHRREWRRHLAGDLRALRAARYDLVVDFQGLLKSAVLARLARGARRIGPSFQREGARLFYTETAEPRNRQRHAVEENLDVLACLGLPRPGRLEFPLAFPPAAPDAPRPRVALIPFSRWPSKNWPAENFAETGRRLRDRSGAALFVLGSAAEAPACDRLAAAIGGRAVSLAGRLSLPQLGGWLQAMDLVISNDSGPMHMAAAAGRPVLALFGPTDPRRTGPWGAGHRVLCGRLPCQPCFDRHCPRGDQACLRAITPAAAADAALAMLAAGSDSGGAG